MRKIGTIKQLILAAVCCLPVLFYGAHTVSAQDYTLSDTKEILEAALHIREAAEHYDLDGDGAVTIKDAQLCLKHVLKIPVTPQDTSTPGPDATLPPSEMPDIPPMVSETPEATQKPDSTPVPQPPVTQPPAPDSSEVPGKPYISTQKITLSSDYSGKEATCVAVTIHNIAAYCPEFSTDLKDYVNIYYSEGICFVHPFYESNQQLDAYRTMLYSEELQAWIRLDPVVTFSEPMIKENSATFLITAVPYASGQFTVEIAYGLPQGNDEEEKFEETFQCEISLYADLQINTTYTIVDEDEVTIPIIPGETVSDVEGFGYVSGNAVHAEEEGTFRKEHYDADTYTYSKK